MIIQVFSARLSLEFHFSHNAINAINSETAVLLSNCAGGGGLFVVHVDRTRTTGQLAWWRERGEAVGRLTTVVRVVVVRSVG